jgi:hypothetical protein
LSGAAFIFNISLLAKSDGGIADADEGYFPLFEFYAGYIYFSRDDFYHAGGFQRLWLMITGLLAVAYCSVYPG